MGLKNKRLSLVKVRDIVNVLKSKRKIENENDFNNIMSFIHGTSRSDLRKITIDIIEYIINKCNNKSLLESIYYIAKNHKNIENYFVRKNVFFICRVVSITKFDDIELGNKFRDLENELTQQIEV